MPSDVISYSITAVEDSVDITQLLGTISGKCNAERSEYEVSSYLSVFVNDCRFKSQSCCTSCCHQMSEDIHKVVSLVVILGFIQLDFFA